VQNIILACRAFGLGSLITINHIRCEDEIKALLGLRPDVSTYALMPIGYPRGKFRPLARKPVSEVAYADRWGAAWPNWLMAVGHAIRLGKSRLTSPHRLDLALWLRLDTRRTLGAHHL
jgi:hypothetical protein